MGGGGGGGGPLAGLYPGVQIRRATIDLIGEFLQAVLSLSPWNVGLDLTSIGFSTTLIY